MKGDFHVRFCEKLGLQCPCLLDPLLAVVIVLDLLANLLFFQHHLLELKCTFLLIFFFQKDYVIYKSIL